MINLKVFIFLNYKNLYMGRSNLVACVIIILMNTLYKKRFENNEICPCIFMKKGLL